LVVVSEAGVDAVPPSQAAFGQVLIHSLAVVAETFVKPLIETALREGVPITTTTMVCTKITTAEGTHEVV
jgi:hypothetical protein